MKYLNIITVLALVGLVGCLPNTGGKDADLDQTIDQSNKDAKAMGKGLVEEAKKDSITVYIGGTKSTLKVPK